MKEPKRYLLKLTLLMILPILVSEYLFRTRMIDVLQWIIENPILFLINLTLLVTLALMLGLIFRKLYRGVLFVFVLSMILGIVNANKVTLRNVPFQLNDLLLVRELLVLTSDLITPFSIALGILAIPVIYGLYRLIKKWFGDSPFSNRKTTALLAAAVCFGILLLGQGLYAEAYGPWQLGFIYSLPRAVVDEEPDTPMATDPKDLNELADRLLGEKDEREGAPPRELEDPHPNVIIFMSEAFWDINLLDGNFTPNPIENFENLREESIHGEVYVPVFGGGTANTEFEVLTGISLKTYPADWHVVYRHDIHEPVPSLASIFKEKGYRTEALHPFFQWYYQRDEVLPLLGFQHFTALEDLEDPPTLGPFVSDDYVTDRLIEQIEASEEPLFNYTLTMQNHAPYHAPRGEPVIDFDHYLNERQENMLQNYANGLYYSDQALKRLVDYLRDSDEPTLLLFFGDHLPMFGGDFDVYREMGFIDDETPEELKDDLRLHTVPYILWANYPLEKEEPPLQNATVLPLLVLEQAGMEKPLHLQLVREIHNRAPLIQNNHYTDGEGNRYDADSEEYQRIIEWYRIIRDELIEERR
ncbi:LTA synthase family protein [Isachenkonia alkalipeptolytica]|uniref:LTA synthase family protein n=1 Tax=Isachenkonia alkalipeptolytica TaxID=2565777 RepID=A0AA43XPI9_9CLOT|nr:LTA synthase family protein [Isachenkonia alkalipeptolytica]NBG89405.1 LTA synthase family protein [Isachenkonia alkalipeptolytica]